MDVGDRNYKVRDFVTNIRKCHQHLEVAEIIYENLCQRKQVQLQIFQKKNSHI